MGTAMGIGIAKAAELVARLPEVTAKLIGMATGAEETRSKFETVFEDSAGVVDQFGERFARMAGLTDVQFQQLAGNVGAVVSGFDMGAPATAKFSNEVLELAGDLQSFHDVPIEETFAALRSGLTGETEPLKRFGIILTQAEVNERALIVARREGIDAADNQAVALARLELMTEKADKAVGDLARTSDSSSNKLRYLSAEARQQADDFAQRLKPALDLVIDALMDSEGALVGLIDTMSEEAAQEITGLISGLLSLIDALSDAAEMLGLTGDELTGVGEGASIIEAELQKIELAIRLVSGGFQMLYGLGVESVLGVLKAVRALRHALGRTELADGMNEDIASLEAQTEDLWRQQREARGAVRDLYAEIAGTEEPEEALDKLSDSMHSLVYGAQNFKGYGTGNTDDDDTDDETAAQLKAREKAHADALKAEDRAADLARSLIADETERRTAMLEAEYDERAQIVREGSAGEIAARMVALDNWRAAEAAKLREIDAQRRELLDPAAFAPTQALTPDRLEMPEFETAPLAGSLDNVDARIGHLRQALSEAGSQGERDFIGRLLTGLEKLRGEMTDTRSDAEKFADAFAGAADHIAKAFSLVTDALTSMSERRLDAIERERDKRLEAIDAEIAAVGQRGEVLTAEEAQRKSLLERREKIEAEFKQKERAERRKLARTEKAAALVQIAINGAIAVSKAYAQLGPLGGTVGAGLVTAATLAQLAVVASKPLPQFADGVTGFAGGAAIVGERGPELVTLGRGSNVVTNENIRAMLADGARSRGGGAVSLDAGALGRTVGQYVERAMRGVEWRWDGFEMVGGIRRVEQDLGRFGLG